MIKRTTSASANPRSLEARLISFSFHLESPYPTGTRSFSKQIPRGFDTYRLKGIVGRLFGIKPLQTRLIWETGEWDPVAGYEEALEEDDDCEDAAEAEVLHPDKGSAIIKNQDGRWTKREVELRDGTREVGFWIEGSEARIRVELRDGESTIRSQGISRSTVH